MNLYLSDLRNPEDKRTQNLFLKFYIRTFG